MEIDNSTPADVHSSSSSCAGSSTAAATTSTTEAASTTSTTTTTDDSKPAEAAAASEQPPDQKDDSNGDQEMQTDAPPADTANDQLNEAIGKVQASRTATMSLKQLLKTMQTAQSSTTPYKIRPDNMAVKKYMIDVNGGADLLKLVGFVESKQEGAKPITYLTYSKDTATNDNLSRAIILLTNAAEPTTASSTTSSSGTSPVKQTTPTKAAAPTGPRLPCKGGCQFFGDAFNDGYCSVCYRKKQMGQLKDDSPSKCKADAVNHCGNFGSDKFNGMCSSCHSKEQKRLKSGRYRFTVVRHLLRAVYIFNKGKRPTQENKTRCWTCHKKIGITGFECRCRYTFCAEHRYAENHDCAYDFKSTHRQNLRKANEQIVGSKLDKIQ